ncbi:MAG: glycosyltransferase family 2 protein [Pseudomonadota bacterium]
MSSDTATAPLLSILLLCWNHARYLEQCITSISAQDLTGVEVVLLDNRSSDGSAALAERLFARHGIAARVLGNAEPKAIPVNFNHLLAQSSGDLVAILSTDDWYEADYVSCLLTAARTHSDAGWFSCSGWLYFDQEQRSEPVDDAQFIIDRPVGEVILAGGEPHFFVGCAYWRSALEAVGGWDETQLIEDRDLFLRLSERFAHHRIDRRLVHYRRSSAAASSNAAFMLEGWERFFAKQANAFGPRLNARRAETYRSYAALLTDQGDYRSAGAALWQALRLRPWSGLSWRTLLYLGRRALAGRNGQRAATRR